MQRTARTGVVVFRFSTLPSAFISFPTTCPYCLALESTVPTSWFWTWGSITTIRCENGCKGLVFQLCKRQLSTYNYRSVNTDVLYAAGILNRLREVHVIARACKEGPIRISYRNEAVSRDAQGWLIPVRSLQTCDQTGHLSLQVLR